MNSARSILTKEIWSRRTDKRILWFVQRCALLVLIIWAALYITVQVNDFVSVRWFTASGRKRTQEFVEQSQKLRSSSIAEIRSIDSMRAEASRMDLDTALNMKLEFQGFFLEGRARNCRDLELQLEKYPAAPRQDKLNALKNKQCGLYEQDLKSLREALKNTPTFRF